MRRSFAPLLLVFFLSCGSAAFGQEYISWNRPGAAPLVSLQERASADWPAIVRSRVAAVVETMIRQSLVPADVGRRLGSSLVQTMLTGRPGAGCSKSKLEEGLQLTAMATNGGKLLPNVVVGRVVAIGNSATWFCSMQVGNTTYYLIDPLVCDNIALIVMIGGVCVKNTGDCDVACRKTVQLLS